MVITSPGMVNKELLIIKKVNVERAFELHNDLTDLTQYYGGIRNAWLTIGISMVGLLLVN